MASMEAGQQDTFMTRANAAGQRRVQELVQQYSSVQHIHPAVTTMRRSHADDLAFQQAMNNDLRLISSRSPDMGDHEINMYEAAFLKLMSNTETHAGAIHIYVEEILGLKAVTQPLKLRALTIAVQLRTLFLNLAEKENPPQHSAMLNNHPLEFPFAFTQNASGMQLLSNLEARSNNHLNLDPFTGARQLSQPFAPNVPGRTSSLNQGQSLSRRRMAEVMHEHNGNAYAVALPTRASGDQILENLILSFRDAKNRFRTTASNDEAHLTYAAFLRDIILECFERIARVSPGDPRLDELHQTYVEVTEVIEQRGREVRQFLGMN
ncbi:MAG: hypothetical protein Q9219_003224 [cf. Caloplaca sp. 3 TL-2023]